MYSHITGETHMRKYMEVKYGFLKKHDSALEKEAKDVEELEGKIHHWIVDFTNQLEDKKYIKREFKNVKREKISSSSSSDSDSSSSDSSSRRHSSRARSPVPMRSPPRQQVAVASVSVDQTELV
ncbi:unnamed protein product [Meganyctiphanes norvegica]|uniref:Transcription factor PAP1 domain-containing protein n=1 Tax=Meganyctiphanes norvegica TaxID=48144 RepID=A0AAV2RPV9_MEGNR